MEKTDDKTVGRDSDKFMLRLPDGMRDRIAASAKENNRSMNAEIVARLGGALETQAALDQASFFSKKMLDLIEGKNAAIGMQRELLSMSAVFLRLVVERVAKSEDPVSNRLMELTSQYANAMIHGNFDAAKAPILEMVELGTKMGILDESGKVKPEHKHLAGPRKKSARKINVD